MQAYCRNCRKITEGQSRGKQFYCHTCKKFPPRDDVATEITKKRSAKILLLDIETSPREVYEWRPNQEWTNPEMVKKEESLLCYGAKWLFSPKILGKSVTPEEAIAGTCESIIGDIWNLMNEAHIIVTQNGVSFDIRKLKSQFILHGFPPPSRFLDVDTKLISKTFGFPYNSLDYLGKRLLGLEGKHDMEFKDWDECVKGNPKALKKMFTYCKNDVAPLLEDIYLKFLPWAENHPNLGVYSDHNGDICPKCESHSLSWTEEYPTPQGLWMGFRCNSCGTVGRGKGKKYKIRTSKIG